MVITIETATTTLKYDISGLEKSIGYMILAMDYTCMKKAFNHL